MLRWVHARVQLTTVCLADPGCYRAIHALAASLPGGRLEVIALAATGEGSAQDAFDAGPTAPARPAATAEPAAAFAGQRRATLDANEAETPGRCSGVRNAQLCIQRHAAAPGPIHGSGARRCGQLAAPAECAAPRGGLLGQRALGLRSGNSIAVIPHAGQGEQASYIRALRTGNSQMLSVAKLAACRKAVLGMAV